MTRILLPYHLDEHLPDLDVPVTPEAVITLDLPEGDQWRRMAYLYDAVAATVADAVRRGARPMVLSGDCTTALGTVAGLQWAGLDPAVVWLDAHGDLQTLETTTSGYLGGMPLRMLVGYRPELVAERVGLRPVPEERVLLAGARDLDPPEVRYLERAAIRRGEVDGLTASALPDGPLYLHLDIDVVDPDQLPGLRFPAPGGPGLPSVAEALSRVIASGRVAAFGLACTWHPGHAAAERVRPDLQPVLQSLV